MGTQGISSVLLNTRVYLPSLPSLTSSLTAAYRRVLRAPRERGLLALPVLRLPGRNAWLDIGGASGQTVAAMRFYSESARILSFEPNCFYVAKMRRRFRDDPGVCVQPIALSSREGRFSLFIPVYKCCAFPDLGTSERDRAANWLANRIRSYNPDDLMVLELSCESRRLDGLSIEPELIKIDCRCDTTDILLGALETVRKHRPVLVVENALIGNSVLEQLASAGYGAFCYAENGLREVALGNRCDLLLPSDHVPDRSAVAQLS